MGFLDLIHGTVQPWPYFPTLLRIGLAVSLGMFVGMERERRGKEAGTRTFAFVALMGCLGGLMGDNYALLSVGLLGVLIVFMNWQRLSTNHTAELTTSAALLVTGFMGVLCGKGHTFTPVTVGVLAAALLTWKESLTDFSVGLTEAELRSAILLAILTFVVYPVLPQNSLDRWGLVEPRATWASVILIAGIGFVNYVLWKLYGTRGVTLAGFLGGLVNSTVTTTELASRVRESGAILIPTAFQGILLATSAMLLRNGVLLGILAWPALCAACLPLGLMLAVCVLGSLIGGRDLYVSAQSDAPTLKIESPFSLKAALKFGLVFLVIHVVGTLAQRDMGPVAFYAVNVVGGLLSSASTVASTATLAAHGQISPLVAANGAVLASLSSAFINLPLIARIGRQSTLTMRLLGVLGAVLVLGILGMVLQGALGAYFRI